MLYTSKSVVLFIALVLGCVVAVVQSSTSVENLHFIDHNNVTNSFLYRSGDPDVGSGTVFSYTQLVSQMKTAAKDVGITLPANFYMIDYNLLDSGDSEELPHIQAEEAYFNANPTKGKVIRHEINGEKTSPFSITSQTDLVNKAKTFDTWSADKLPAFIDEIHAAISNTTTNTQTICGAKVNVPNVVLFHCMCGCDRTGEVAGAYYMQYLGMNLHDAHALCKTIAGAELDKPNYQAMYWHCFYLKYGKGMDIECVA